MYDYKDMLTFLKKIPQPGNGRIVPAVEIIARSGSRLLGSIVFEYGELKRVISSFEEMIAKNEKERMEDDIQNRSPASFRSLLIRHFQLVADQEGRKFAAKILEDVEERADAAIASLENFTGQKFAPEESKNGKQEVAALKREDLTDGLTMDAKSKIVSEAVGRALHGDKEILKVLLERMPL